MILISIQREEDVSLAKCLATALHGHGRVHAVFLDAKLAQEHGDAFDSSSADLSTCVLNADQFQLLVVFASARTSENLANLRLVELMNEIGVATLEIQHRLFQFEPSSEAFPIGHAAKHLLRWDGPQGIGYLKSGSAEAADLLLRDFVLITSSDRLTEKARYQFIISVLKLAASAPERQFVFRPHPGELRMESARSALDMLEGYQLSNLAVERRHSTEQLALRSTCGISCVSTTLLDLSRHTKPTLVFTPADGPSLPAHLKLKTFHNAQGLLEAFRAMQRNPKDFSFDLKISDLDVTRLVSALKSARAATSLTQGWSAVTTRFAQRLVAESARPSDNQGEERILKAIANLKERVSILQRSTLAYKAKQLTKRIKKSAE